MLGLHSLKRRSGCKWFGSCKALALLRCISSTLLSQTLCIFWINQVPSQANLLTYPCNKSIVGMKSSLKPTTQVRRFHKNQPLLSCAMPIFQCQVLETKLVVADWFGKATVNTSSFTPFKGAYMHFLWEMRDTDSNKLIATAAKMESIMAAVTSEIYAYVNLSSDPHPGKHSLSVHNESREE